MRLFCQGFGYILGLCTSGCAGFVAFRAFRSRLALSFLKGIGFSVCFKGLGFSFPFKGLGLRLSLGCRVLALSCRVSGLGSRGKLRVSASKPNMRTQNLQNPLIKEYTLNYNRIPNMI